VSRFSASTRKPAAKLPPQHTHVQTRTHALTRGARAHATRVSLPLGSSSILPLSPAHTHTHTHTCCLQWPIIAHRRGVGVSCGQHLACPNANPQPSRLDHPAPLFRPAAQTEGRTRKLPSCRW
jgi:hypothetical protein